MTGSGGFLRKPKELPDGLILARDSDTHYLLLPAWEMSLDNYKKLLLEAEPLFINYLDYVQRKKL